MADESIHRDIDPAENDPLLLDSLILLGEIRALVRVIYGSIKDTNTDTLDSLIFSDLDGGDLVSLAYSATTKLDRYHAMANDAAVNRPRSSL